MKKLYFLFLVMFSSFLCITMTSKVFLMLGDDELFDADSFDEDDDSFEEDESIPQIDKKYLEILKKIKSHFDSRISISPEQENELQKIYNEWRIDQDDLNYDYFGTAILNALNLDESSDFEPFLSKILVKLNFLDLLRQAFDNAENQTNLIQEAGIKIKGQGYRIDTIKLWLDDIYKKNGIFRSNVFSIIEPILGDVQKNANNRWEKEWLLEVKKNYLESSNESIKNLQNDLIQKNVRHIFQLRSLDQHNKEKLPIQNSAVACGYFSVFNIQHIIEQKLFEKKPQDLIKDKVVLSEKEKWEDGYQNLHEISTYHDFLTWEMEGKKVLIEAYKKIFNAKIEEALKNNTWTQIRDILVRTYQIDFPEQDSGMTEEKKAKLSNDVVNGMLFGSDLKILEKIVKKDQNFGSFNYWEMLNIQRIIADKKLSLKDIVNIGEENLPRLAGLDLIINQKPVFGIINPGRSHWIAVFVNHYGMFIIDSENTDRKNDKTMWLLYDLIMLPPKDLQIHDEQPKSITQSTQLEQVQMLLKMLKQKLCKLLEMVVKMITK